MKKMLYYEIKKIFVKTSNRLALLVLIIALCIVCYRAISGVEFVDENGKTETGINAVQELKTAKKEWAGILTEDKIAKVIRENERINQTKEYQSENDQMNNIAYSWKQGFSDIRNLLILSYGNFREYDYYIPDSLSAEDAGEFYKNRTAHLREWLDTEAKENYSEKEKEFLVQKYEKLKTPLNYDWTEGWKQLLENSSAILMIMMLVLGFLVSNIFPGEFRLKADSIFYSTYYGRNKAIAAKIQAGLLITTVIYWSAMFIFSVVILGSIGFEGGNIPIQTSRTGWKSFYNISYFQEFIIVLIGGYIGTLFIMLLTMLISAKTKSVVFAVVVPFILIFIPSFLSGSGNFTIEKIIGLLPNQLLQMNVTISSFDLYQIGRNIFGASEILFVLYAGISIIICPLLYCIYRRIEEK